MDILIDLKHKEKVYFPFEDDELDFILSNYINNHTDSVKLARMFRRDDNGVYHFGTKKAFLKTEKNKLSVRVGGGFINIDDWVRENLNIEFERYVNKESQPTKLSTSKTRVQSN